MREEVFLPVNYFPKLIDLLWRMREEVFLPVTGSAVLEGAVRAPELPAEALCIIAAVHVNMIKQRPPPLDNVKTVGAGVLTQRLWDVISL